MRPAVRLILLLSALLPTIFSSGAAQDRFFEIQAVDADTGRGIPLVQFKLNNHVAYISDNAGRVAFYEPGLMDQEVFFSVSSHGYEFPKDGFDMTGFRVKPKAGARHTVKLKRRNIAERLYRITGEGTWRDSVLLGYEPPVKNPLLNGEVLGQDSIQPVLYKGRHYWFWGDTSRLNYPLGNFRMSGAIASPAATGVGAGIDLTYFTNSTGFCRGMCPWEPKGDLIWADGIFTTTRDGKEVMVGHYEKLKGLGKFIEHGLCIWNDERDEFEKLRALEKEQKWRAPAGQPFKLKEAGEEYVYFGSPVPNVRVRDNFEAITNPSEYEAFTCFESDGKTLAKGSDGRPRYRWSKDAPPITTPAEKKLIESGDLKQDEARFSPVDVETGKQVLLHGGTVRWNPWRSRWICIAVEQYGTSFLGEVWYSEAPEPTGPFSKAIKIVTHEQYSFYNPVHHAEFDEDGGRVIYFEGTYTAEFSGNKNPTPRYDYNQVMYKADLADPRFKELFGKE